MPRLIWDFAVRTGHFVAFVICWLRLSLRRSVISFMVQNFVLRRLVRGTVIHNFWPHLSIWPFSIVVSILHFVHISFEIAQFSTNSQRCQAYRTNISNQWKTTLCNETWHPISDSKSQNLLSQVFDVIQSDEATYLQVHYAGHFLTFICISNIYWLKVLLLFQRIAGDTNVHFFDAMMRLRDTVSQNWKEMRRAFRSADPTGMGLVDNNDFRRVLRQFSVNLTEDEFFHLLSYYDKNMDGQIVYNDFIRAYLHNSWVWYKIY